MAVPEGTLVQLEQKAWRVGEPLGKGGFGAVYAAAGPDNEQAALKFVPIDPKAARELDVWSDLGDLLGIIPLLDDGEWDQWRVLAMPRAECDLRTYLRQQGGPIPLEEARTILLDIATALVSLSEREGEPIVHRDLKPENILKWGGRWCLADFGIARYAEQTTATHTLKEHRSWPYAAPELWKEERAESRTDVYAVGIIAYELLRGERPFAGRTVDRYKAQHLGEFPPRLDGDAVGVGLAGLIESCLHKDTTSRPTPTELHRRLQHFVNTSSPGFSAALQRANRAAVQENTEREIALQHEQERIETRERQWQDARQSLDFVAQALWDTLSINAQALVRAYDPKHLDSGVGARLVDTPSVVATITRVLPVHDVQWSGNQPCFDVIAEAAIRLAIVGTGNVERRGAHYALWYCDAQQAGAYRWFEVSFKRAGAIFRREPWEEPERVDLERAGDAISRRMYSHRLASPFTPIDGADTEEFVRRWVEHIGNAFEGTLPSIGPFEPGEISRSHRC